MRLMHGGRMLMFVRVDICNFRVKYSYYLFHTIILSLSLSLSVVHMHTHKQEAAVLNGTPSNRANITSFNVQKIDNT